ncbi:MAG TPA: hypothetical protein VFR78_12555 [Pyrinomonadaceae bacterium]|nr:hypothetical protein [Pyrinomonadaceae bacterium]
MRAYLLGTLDPDQRTQFEERLQREEGLFEELLAEEAELTDEFNAGHLSELDQRQFNKVLASTAEGRDNVGFSALLKRYADSLDPVIQSEPAPRPVVQPRETAPARDPFSFLPLMRRHAYASAAVAVAGAAILALCWLTMYAPKQGEPRVIEATLTPGVTRSTGTTNRVTVPPEGPFKVKLKLELTNASFNNYKSQLFRESKSLLTRDNLKMESSGAQQVVPVEIGGEILIPGDYQLKLSGVLDSGADEFIDNYSFRIATE